MYRDRSNMGESESLVSAETHFHQGLIVFFGIIVLVITVYIIRSFFQDKSDGETDENNENIDKNNKLNENKNINENNKLNENKNINNN